MTSEWESMSDKDLANEAQAGGRGQGAVVEAMCRLRYSTNRLGYVNMAMTFAILIAAAIQIVLLVK